MPTKFNTTFAEKVCFLLIIFMVAFLFYVCGYKLFNHLTPTVDTFNFRDIVTFSVSITSLFLALMLYSDWREKYVAESLDKDLREIKALVSDINFIVNRFPTTQNEIHVGEREEFFKIFWKLRVLNSNIKYADLNALNAEVDLFLTTSHGFINAMQDDFNNQYMSISERSKVMFDSINDLIETYRKENLKILN